MFNQGLTILAGCIQSLLFGEVCDSCNGEAIFSLLAGIIRIFTGILGILAVIGILVVGISYLKSSGDPAKRNKARSRLIGIIIGIALYVVAFAITEFLMPGGVINHPISHTEETNCPETTYTDATINRDPISELDPGDLANLPSPYAGTKPNASQNKAKYNSKDYNYIEISNATPFVYTPSERKSFSETVKKIAQKEEGENILIIANAGTFNTTTYEPTGIVIQNGQVISDKEVDNSYSVFVVDKEGNVGYSNNKSYKAKDYAEGKASYIDALTGEIVSGKKIISAVTNFGPIVINGQYAGSKFIANSHYNDRRARQIYCLKSDKTNVIITNKEEGSSGGWNYKQMADAAIERGCQFAFNLDGGGSTATAWRSTSNSSFNNGSSPYKAGNRKVPSYIIFTENNLPAGQSLSNYYLAQGILEIKPQITPKCSIIHSLESETLKINVCKDGDLYLSYVWAKDPNKQLSKKYAADYPEAGSKTVERAKLGDKIAIAFNMSEPVHTGEWYGKWPKKNKAYEHTEPSPIIITNGSTLVHPGEGKNNTNHIMAWISNSGILQYSYQLSNYTNTSAMQSLYSTMLQSGTRNTMLVRSVFIMNGQKSNLKKWSIGGKEDKVRTGGVTLCQLDTNNYIVITFKGSTTYKHFQDKLLKYGCQTAVSGDGGGSTATYLKKKNGNIISLDSTSRAPAMFYFTEL